ncbi:MAG TPA: hypothetical protein VF846_09425 [Thermoanaerobaculia bacterium]
MDDKRVVPWRPSVKQRAEQFAAAAQQLQREREDAPAALTRILAATARADIPTLVERPELRTAGAVEHLGTILSAELTKEPRYAEALAMLAISLAEALPPVYPSVILRQLRVHAWKDLGKVLSFLARQDEAIEAYDRAEAELGDISLEHDRSIVRLNRAITYQEIGRFDEALVLLAECKEIFGEYRDVRLATISGFYEGLLLQRMRRYREAREMHLLLLAANANLDEDTLAALHNAIGYASIELGEYDAAEANLTRAANLFQQLNQPLEALKPQLGHGRLLIRRGRYTEAIAHLRKVRHQFLRNSLAEEAGLCGLEMVEGMLLLGRHEDAETLARTIMSEFLAADLSTRAIEALGYLSEAIASSKASPKMANDVREYVVSLRTFPERAFTHSEL